jgi:hypothetical protein
VLETNPRRAPHTTDRAQPAAARQRPVKTLCAQPGFQFGSPSRAGLTEPVFEEAVETAPT